MLIMSTTSIYLAFLDSVPTNKVVGPLTIYLVFTARRAASNRKGVFDRIDILFMAYVLLVAIFGAYLSVGVVNGHSLEGTPFGPLEYFLFFYTGMAALCVFLDLSALLRGGVVGVKRIARHLWRMMFAMWIATGSLFAGQPQVFPKFLRDHPLILLSPFILISILLIVWIIRVWFVKRFKLIG